MKRLVFATTNPHKVRELAQLVAPLDMRVVTTLHVDPDAPEVEENGVTFEENAALKAIAGFVRAGEWCLADDSGICIHALDNAPGIHSARWAGPDCNSDDNNRKLLADLSGIDARGAHYYCALVVALPANALGGLQSSDDVTVHLKWPGLPPGAALLSTGGRVDGTINHGAAGVGGFGYDPYFFVETEGCTFAEMSAERKHALSHRGHAFRQLVRFLKQMR
jgi:XTP/dITP diphosphohydrolase